MTVLAKPVWLFFQECTFPFFLTRSLIDMCQIMTDTCKNNVSKFVRKPFKSPLSYSLRTWKCFGEASLFNLHHLYFNYHLPAQNIAQFTCVRLWQILVKIMFQSLLGSLLNHLCLIHYVHENVLVKHLSLICITSILTTIYPLKILLNLHVSDYDRYL